ncbi:MAG: hypothetical protein GWP91_14200 [Rhodobacterales bacterium]|nr:hypothetical protein [Rhodobacterales bacterium]
MASVAPDTPVGVSIQSATGAFEERVLWMRSVDVDSTTGLSFALENGFQLFDVVGQDLGTSGVLDAGQHTLFVAATDLVDGPLVFTPDGVCTPESARWDLQARPPTQLAGVGQIEAPGFDYAQALNSDTILETALSSQHHPDRVGLAYDAYVVRHKSPEEWAQDPTLSDVGDGPVSTTVASGGPPANHNTLWSSDLVVDPGSVSTAYDIVYDFDQDGAFGSGDLIDGGAQPGFIAVRDLTEAGPYGTTTSEYSTGFWSTMRVYVPEPADQAFPLVVISHGNGHDYTWYDYLGEHLASWGYVVISHRNDTEPGVVAASRTTLINTEVFLRDLGEQGLTGVVDPHNIIWVGHSRGGEGIVIAYDQMVNGSTQFTEFISDDVKMLLSIAPTNFEGPDGANPRDADFLILSGGADGDVTGGVESGITQYYRMFMRGTGNHYVTYVHGADHNDFNCCGANDGAWGFSVQGNPPLIGRPRAQAVAKSYLLAILEGRIRGNDALLDYFKRGSEQFRPIGAEAYLATQHMPGANTDKWGLDDFQSGPDKSESSAGTTVTLTVENVAEGPLDDDNNTLSALISDPSNGMTWAHNDPNPERGMVFDFTAPGSATWALPTDQQDLRDDAFFSMRITQGTRHPNTVNLDDLLSFEVILEDADGTTSALDVTPRGRIPEPYERGGSGNGVGWVNEFQTVQLRLTNFSADSDIDLSRITALSLSFGGANSSALGRVGVDDLEFLAAPLEAR